MSKVKFSFSALLMLILVGMFATFASAEDFTPTTTNPAPGINVGDVDNFGNQNTHKTHGNFQNNTNSCANCHSTHNGEDEMLLMKAGEYELCMSCHDGTMGFYNVKEASGAGVFNTSHEDATMHNVNSNLAIGSAPGAAANTSTAELECSSCHNPHGSANDRLLNETVLGKTYSYNVKGAMGSSHGPSFSKDTASPIPAGQQAIKLVLKEDPAYTEINNATGLSGLKITTSMGPDGARDRINYSNFCSVCHDNYLASRTAKKPNLDNGGKEEGVYTHTTNSHKGGRNCASCHYAHGTDNTTLMDASGRTASELVADGVISAEKAESYIKDVSVKGSALKKFTNMSVCFSCHAGEGESLGGPDAAGKNAAGAPDTPLYKYTAPDGSQPGWNNTDWRTATYDPAFAEELTHIIEQYDAKYGN
jgi:predicted CXXCH cytochrome family protein